MALRSLIISTLLIFGVFDVYPQVGQFINSDEFYVFKFEVSKIKVHEFEGEEFWFKDFDFYNIDKYSNENSIEWSNEDADLFNLFLEDEYVILSYLPSFGLGYVSLFYNRKTKKSVLRNFTVTEANRSFKSVQLVCIRTGIDFSKNQRWFQSGKLYLPSFKLIWGLKDY